MRERLITRSTIREYFHDSISDAIRNQQVNTEPETVFYLVNMLTNFTRSEQLFEQTSNGLEFKPLALRYADAIEETAGHEQTRILQKLGDSALFIAGIFPGSLNRKLVDVDYYIAMGGNAYSSVSDRLRNTPNMRTLQNLFSELTRKFSNFVDVLSEVSEQTHLGNNTDLMRLYEIWLRTGSKRAKQRLHQLGIAPIADSKPDYRH